MRDEVYEGEYQGYIDELANIFRQQRKLKEKAKDLRAEKKQLYFGVRADGFNRLKITKAALVRIMEEEQNNVY